MSWTSGTPQFDHAAISVSRLAEAIWQFVTFALGLATSTNLSHKRNKIDIMIHHFTVVDIMELIQIVKFKLKQVILVNDVLFTALTVQSYSSFHCVWSPHTPFAAEPFMLSLTVARHETMKSLVKGEAICLFYQGRFLNANVVDCCSVNSISFLLFV